MFDNKSYSIPELEQRRQRVRMGIRRTIITIIAIDTLLILRMLGAI